MHNKKGIFSRSKDTISYEKLQRILKKQKIKLSLQTISLIKICRRLKNWIFRQEINDKNS